MNLKQIYQFSKGSYSYHQFENTIAEKMFNCPKSADSSELTDKLYLTDGSDAKKQAIEFLDWTSTSGYSQSMEKGIWTHDMDIMMEEQFTTQQLYELFKQKGTEK